MAKAFLSHSSSDKNLVRKIAEQLGRQKCILDEWSFEAGEDTLDEIYKRLDDSDILVLFISNMALDSPWVKKEVKRARNNIDNGMMEKIFPIIIDDNITHKDPRIPKWMVKSYNLKKVTNEKVLLNKIQRAMRSVNVVKSRNDSVVENIFVGRTKELQLFEQEYNNIDDWVPTCIVANSYYEGIGRRTFLKIALERNNVVDKFVYRPLTISIDSRESIENFIYQLNFINPKDAYTGMDLTTFTLAEKVTIAENIVKEYIAANEIIFIVDDGGIINPDGSFVDWFSSLVERVCSLKTIVFCLISSFRPKVKLRPGKEKWFLSYDIPELNSADTKTLFLRLLKANKIDINDAETKMFFLSNLKGIPQQILYAVALIKADLQDARANITDIVEFSDRYSSTMLDIIKKDNIAYQIAVFLSKYDVVGLDIVEKVFGSGDCVQTALKSLYDLSAFTFVFDDHGHVKLNSTLADYISRIRGTLADKYKNAFINARKQLLLKDLDELVCYDYSAFLITLQEMLHEGHRIPAKYYMPSLLIKYVSKMYDAGKYIKVIEICESLLANSNYDSRIIWETKYLLLQSYARRCDSNFFKYINDFSSDPVSYHFLKGFYFRFKKETDLALEEFDKVLNISPNHSRTKREIVNILLSDAKYEEALPMAKDNYYQRRNNIFHLQSYFIALSRRQLVSSEEKTEIEKLMREAEYLSGSYQKAKDIFICMKGEYEYYIQNNFNKAEATLKEALNSNENKQYPFKSLREMYRLENKVVEVKTLDEKYGKDELST